MQQDYINFSFFPTASLTNAYVVGNVLAPNKLGTDKTFSVSPHLENQILLYVNFTKGALSTASIIVEFSADGTTWYQESYEDVPTGGVAACTTYTRSLSATGKYRFAIPVKDKYIRVSAKGNITDNTSSLSIIGVIGIV